MPEIQFQGGLLPNDPSKPRLKLAQRLSAAPANPPTADYMSRINNWPMYRNDVAGCCVWATIGHQLQLLSLYGSDREVVLSEADVIKGYSDVTGYDPAQTRPDGSNPTDQGTVIQDALSYWRKTGLAGHKILAFAEVDVRDHDEVEAAIYIFGTVHIGMDFARSAEDQFNAGQQWDVVSRDGGSLGGHAVPVAAYDTPHRMWRSVSWARPQDMTLAFWDRYVSEAWIVITPEWLDANGHSPEGVDLHGLGEDFAQLTGKPNPFPAPQPPAPVPGPGPVPVPPAVDDADRTLARTVKDWAASPHIGANAVAARAVKLWLIRKGLT